MTEPSRQLLENAHRSLMDAEGDLSRAVRAIEEGESLDVVSLLGEAMTRLRILDAEIERHLAGSRKSRERGDILRLDREQRDQ
ncbi:MAG: hypothetical protein GEU81_10080 [Nitriliruptorales bacterium]|nr:hypothetical protein [Nitriliruptorales bacterium]